MPPLSALGLSPKLTLIVGSIIFILVYLGGVYINQKTNKGASLTHVLQHKVSVHFYILSLLIASLVVFFLLYLSEKNSETPVLSARTECPAEAEKSELSSWKRLSDNKSEWDLAEMDKPADGIYCPHIYKNDFNYRTVWFQHYIPVVFNQIQIRFTIKQPDMDENPSVALVQFGDVYGEGYDIANLHLPFDKTRVINFEYYDSKSSGLTFLDNAGTLPLPIKPGSKVTITINANILDNTIRYQYHIAYIPYGESDSISKDLQYLIKLPDPSPEQLLMKIGIGVYASSCLQDIEYVIPS